MAAPQGKFTDLPEIGAYVIAHAAGLVWGVTANPVILRKAITLGYRELFVVIVVALAIAASVVVLLIFLFLRKLMAGAGEPPPPAAAPPPPPSLTDLPEIAAYIIAHALGIAWGIIANPIIFRSLIASGHRNLMPIGISISIAVSVVVLLIFLFLRKMMARASAPT